VAGEVHPVLLFPGFMYVAGLFIGALQVEVLAKPFAYCLPGHERVPARLLFGFGLCSGLVWSVLAMLYPVGDWGQAILMGISVFFASTLVYWLMVWTVFRFQNWTGAIGLFVLAVVFVPYFDLEGVLRRVLSEGWMFVVACGCAANVAAWRSLNGRGLARRYCGRMWLGAFDPWNKERMAKFSQARMAQKKADAFGVRPGVERFFVARIRGGSGLAQYVWGNLYRSCGVKVSQRKGWVSLILMALATVCFCGYMGAGVNILFIMAGLMVLWMRLGVHSNLLIAGGRRERFWSALVLALATALYVTGMVTLLAGVSVLLGPVMPELTVRGHGVVYRAMDMRYFVVPLAMIPVTLTFGLVFYRQPWLAIGAVMLLFVLFVLFSQIPLVAGQIPDMAVDPVLAAIVAVVVCWTMFAAVLRYMCMRRRLVH
jgi:hypothetical protein